MPRSDGGGLVPRRPLPGLPQPLPPPPAALSTPAGTCLRPPPQGLPGCCHQTGPLSGLAGSCSLPGPVLGRRAVCCLPRQRPWTRSGVSTPRARLEGCPGETLLLPGGLGALPHCVPFARRYQQILHRNLVYLATIADSNQNMQSLLPAVSACGGPAGDSGPHRPVRSPSAVWGAAV